MSLSPLRIDSISPMVQYTALDTVGWTSSPGNITEGDTHTGQPYHFTTSAAANFRFSFFGSGVRLFGATSPVSAPCTFKATVDGKSTQSAPKNAAVLAEFSSLKFGNHDMAVNVSCPGEATVSSVFRFDFAEFDAGVVNDTVLDDGNSALRYEGHWTHNADLASPGFFDDTQQFTSSANDSVSLNFTAGGIAVFGSVQSTHGLYTVTVDGATQTLDGSNPFLAVPALIYFRADLDPVKQHIITIANAGLDGQFLDIDSFTLLDTASPSTQHHTNVAAIAVGLISALLILLIPLYFVIQHYRRRNTHLPHHRIDLDERALSPHTLEINSDIMPRPFKFPRGGSNTSIPRMRPSFSSPFASARTLPRVSGGALPALPPNPTSAPARPTLQRETTKQRMARSASVNVPPPLPTVTPPSPTNPTHSQPLSRARTHTRSLSMTLPPAELDQLAERVVRYMQNGASVNRRGHRQTLSTHTHDNTHNTTSVHTAAGALSEAGTNVANCDGEDGHAASSDTEDELEDARLASLVSQRVSSMHRRPYLAGWYVVNGGTVMTPDSDNPPPLYGE